MMKTPDQIKNIVEDWIKITGIKYQEITHQENQDKLEWALHVKPTLIIYMTKRKDRVILESQLNFASEHQESTENMSDKDFLEFTNNINEYLVIAGIQPVYKQKQKRIEAMKITGYVDIESLTRDSFYKTWDKVSAFHQIVINKIQIKFGIKGTFNPSSGSVNAGPYG